MWLRHGKAVSWRHSPYADSRHTCFRGQVRGSNRVTDQDPEGKYEALSKYGRDLTVAARDGKLDPVIGRDDEIRYDIIFSEFSSFCALDHAV